jgi:hypothetical protein
MLDKRFGAIKASWRLCAAHPNITSMACTSTGAEAVPAEAETATLLETCIAVGRPCTARLIGYGIVA